MGYREQTDSNEKRHYRKAEPPLAPLWHGVDQAKFSPSKKRINREDAF